MNRGRNKLWAVLFFASIASLFSVFDQSFAGPKVSNDYVFRSAVGDTIIISPKDNPEKKIFLRKGQTLNGLVLSRSTGKSAFFVDKRGSTKSEVVVQYAQMDETPAKKGAKANTKQLAPSTYSNSYDEHFDEFDDEYEASDLRRDYEAPPPPPAPEPWDRGGRGSPSTGISEGSPSLAPLTDEEIDELLLGDEEFPISNSQLAPVRDPEINTPRTKDPKPGSVLRNLDQKGGTRLNDPHGAKETLSR